MSEVRQPNEPKLQKPTNRHKIQRKQFLKTFRIIATKSGLEMSRTFRQRRSISRCSGRGKCIDGFQVGLVILKYVFLYDKSVVTTMINDNVKLFIHFHSFSFTRELGLLVDH